MYDYVVLLAFVLDGPHIRASCAAFVHNSISVPAGEGCLSPLSSSSYCVREKTGLSLEVTPICSPAHLLSSPGCGSEYWSQKVTALSLLISILLLICTRTRQLVLGCLYLPPAAISEVPCYCVFILYSPAGTHETPLGFMSPSRTLDGGGSMDGGRPCSSPQTVFQTSSQSRPPDLLMEMK